MRTNLGVLIIHEDIATLYVNCPISALVVMTMIVATKKVNKTQLVET